MTRHFLPGGYPNPDPYYIRPEEEARMTTTRHVITATQSGSHPTMGDWDVEYQITFTYEPGEEPVFVSVDPGPGDHGAFTDLAERWHLDWAKNWLDENADKAMDKAETERAAPNWHERAVAPWHDPSVKWVCEQHPDLEWPHDDCAGPGMVEDTPENRAKGYVGERGKP